MPNTNMENESLTFFEPLKEDNSLTRSTILQSVLGLFSFKKGVKTLLELCFVFLYGRKYCTVIKCMHFSHKNGWFHFNNLAQINIFVYNFNVILVWLFTFSLFAVFHICAYMPNCGNSIQINCTICLKFYKTLRILKDFGWNFLTE